MNRLLTDRQLELLQRACSGPVALDPRLHDAELAVLLRAGLLRTQETACVALTDAGRRYARVALALTPQRAD